ncbi:hypothetical protein [Labrys neptuniae]
MTDRPILFSGAMIRALLAGTKTQTRRLIHARASTWKPSLFDGTWSDSYVLDPGNQSWRDDAYPWRVGDRLWVRERGLESVKAPLFRMFAHAATPGRFWVDSDGGRHGAGYGGDITFEKLSRSRDWKVRPSIHMPRWASRLTLIVTGVKVERLQDISEDDAIAEGVIEEYGVIGSHCAGGRHHEVNGYRYYYAGQEAGEEGTEDAASAYALLWDRINGSGSWDANPWVVAISFDVHKQNIDAMKEAA